jgi:2-keto-4-pentenoate hydratase/2-oxohepta-3-ene-1,7-dioic acid hydratase in catechol pathway
LKWLNFAVPGRTSFGVVSDGGIMDVRSRLDTQAVDLLSLIRSPDLEAARALAQVPSVDYRLEDARILSPAGRHTRYFCIGVNYPERNEEYKDGSERPRYPSIFMRSHTSLVAHEEPIVRPRESEQLDYEGEIVIVLGTGGRRIAESDALKHVFGYSCANEGTVRDWLRHAKFNVTPGKNFDCSGSIGPWVTSADEFGERALRVTTRVNGETRQDDTSDRMLFPMSFLIAYLSRFCTLEPGDVILSGTPAGAGARLDPPRYLRPGDVVEVEVSGVGTLRNRVVDDTT